MAEKRNRMAQAQIDIYQPSFIKYGDTPLGTRQNDIETRSLRFQRLVREFFPIEGRPTLHDVGSGVCDLHAYLVDKKIEHQYCGSEVVSEMAAFSREKYPDIVVDEIDFLSSKENEKFDFLTACGVFYIPGTIEHGPWRTHCHEIAQHMFNKCKKAISFNCLSTHNTFNSKDVCYFNPGEVLDFCFNNLSRFVVLDHAYPLYEFTVTVFKEETIRMQHPSAKLDKYFSR